MDEILIAIVFGIISLGIKFFQKKSENPQEVKEKIDKALSPSTQSPSNTSHTEKFRHLYSKHPQPPSLHGKSNQKNTGLLSRNAQWQRNSQAAQKVTAKSENVFNKTEDDIVEYATRSLDNDTTIRRPYQKTVHSIGVKRPKANDLRQAIIWKEILDKPKALRNK